MRGILRWFAGLWYWRHRVIVMEGNLFTGRTVLWCGHCGGSIRTQVHANRRRAVVAEATCPAGIAYQRIGGD